MSLKIAVSVVRSRPWGTNASTDLRQFTSALEFNCWCLFNHRRTMRTDVQSSVPAHLAFLLGNELDCIPQLRRRDGRSRGSRLPPRYVAERSTVPPSRLQPCGEDHARSNGAAA